ncbi:MAG: T9SS type A sorting domain-containing protein [Candidatus Delongbacteria bacterium]
MKKIIFILIIALKLFAQYEWSTPVQLSEQGIYPDSWHYAPAITVDNNGVLHAFWVKNVEFMDMNWYSQIEYRYSTDGGFNWSVIQTLTPEYMDNRIYEIQAGCDSLNNIHLFYIRGAEPGVILYKQYNGIYWSEPYEITHYATKRIRPVFDRNGRLYLTWNYALTAYYSFSDLTEIPPVWQEPKAINEGVSLETYLSCYNYVFDSKNNFYAIGTAHNGDYYVPVNYQYDSSTDTWHSFEVFEEYSESSNGVEMTISDNDTLYANILVGNMSVNSNYMQKKHIDDTEWSEPEFVNINNTWDYRKLCVDSNNGLHIFEGNFDVNARLSYSNNQNGFWNIDLFQTDTLYSFSPFNVDWTKDEKFFIVYKKHEMSNNNSRIYFQTKQIEVGIEEEPCIISDIKLYQNYPNPFNNETEISFYLEETAEIELIVYNSKGEQVESVIKQKMSKGVHSINYCASKLNSGVYYYQLKIDGIAKDTKKMLYLK